MQCSVATRPCHASINLIHGDRQFAARWKRLLPISRSRSADGPMQGCRVGPNVVGDILTDLPDAHRSSTASRIYINFTVFQNEHTVAYFLSKSAKNQPFRFVFVQISKEFHLNVSEAVHCLVICRSYATAGSYIASSKSECILNRLLLL